MSIALSLLIRSSRYLKTAVCGLCAMLLAVAGAVVFGLAGSFSVFGKTLIALMSLLSVASAILVFHRQQKTWRMNISPEGIIRLHQETDAQYPDGESGVFRMMPDSTLWPGVMLLHLQSGTGQSMILRILPDSVGPHEFRALSVALRWIAARGGRSESDFMGNPLQR